MIRHHKLLIAFTEKHTETITVTIEDKERIINAMNGDRTVSVSDFGWDPAAPRTVAINGKAVRAITEIGVESYAG